MQIRTAAACARRLRHTGSAALVDEHLSLPALGLLVALATADTSRDAELVWARAGSRREELVGELEQRGYLRRVDEEWLLSDDPADLLSPEELISPGRRDPDVIREGIALAKKAIAAAGQQDDRSPAPAGSPASEIPSAQDHPRPSHLEASGFYAGDFGIHRDRQGHPAVGERAASPALCVICGKAADSTFEGVAVHVPCYWVSTRATRTHSGASTQPAGSPSQVDPQTAADDPS